MFLASSWFPRSPDPGEIPVRVFPERSAESADTPEEKTRFPSATGEAARSAERVEAKLDWPLEPGRSRLVRLAIERATEGIGSSP